VKSFQTKDNRRRTPSDGNSSPGPKNTQGIEVQKNMKIKKEDLGRVRANKQYFNLGPVETTDTHGDCSKQQFSYQYLLLH
jgi:hypothetical protein